MKAIQIRYIAATNHLGSRLKVFAEGVPAKFYQRNYDLEPLQQARAVAMHYSVDKGWGPIHGFGTLPNGDYVATLGE